MPTMTDQSPRIYVASLSDYNAGRLHGAWIDASDTDEMREAIGAMLKASPEPGAEEYAIHDFDGFGSLRLSEYEDLDRIAELSAGIEEHSAEVVAAFLDRVGSDESLTDLEEQYRGEWDSVTEYVEELAEDIGLLSEVPENLRCYFDMERFGRDMELGGNITATRSPSGGVYIFAA